VDPLLRAATGLLMAVVGLVLLLACTNLASFLLARAIDRSQEAAVRRALGATRGALARQLLVESVLLGLGGAAAGLALAFALLNVLLWVDLPLSYGMRLDVHFGLDWTMLFGWKVLALTAGAGVLAGVMLGLVPAVQGTRADLGAALKTGSRGSDAPRALKWRNVLVVSQVAMSLVLLVGAGLFLRSWQRTLAVDPGFGRAPTAILSVMVPVRQSAPDEAVRRTRLLLERFRALTGVEAAGVIQPLPLEFAFSFTDFTIDGRTPPAGQETFRADSAFVDGGFFDAAGMDIVEGRTFNDDDRRDNRPVAVISRAMAVRYWPDGSALGRILRRPDPALPDVEIVGVAGDIMVRSLGEPPRDLIYTPYTQGPGIPMLNFLVRTAGDPSRMLPLLATAGQEVVPDLRVVETTTMMEHCDGRGARLGRALRDGAVYGGDENPRGRDPHGARRRGPRRHASARGTRPAAGAAGERYRRGCVAARRTLPRDTALQRRDIRPGCVHRCAGRSRRGGVAGRVAARTPGQPRGPARCAAQRIACSKPEPAGEWACLYAAACE
jgi:predicted permease